MSSFLGSLLHGVCPAYRRRSLASTLFRLGLIVFIAGWSWRYFTITVKELGEDWGWFHHVHLVFHEAGHALFAMITHHQQVVAFMGSGLQVLFPLIVAGSFYWKNSDGVGAALGLWWAGHAVLDVAPYVADARALELPLLTGGTGREVEGHDWEYLLTAWNALHLDVAIGETLAFGGRVIMGVALVWAALNAYHDYWMLSDED